MGVYCKIREPLTCSAPLKCYKIMLRDENANGTYRYKSLYQHMDYTPYFPSDSDTIGQTYYPTKHDMLPTPTPSRLSDYPDTLYYYDCGGCVYSFTDLGEAMDYCEKFHSPIVSNPSSPMPRIIECEIPADTQFNAGNMTHLLMLDTMKDKPDTFISASIRIKRDMTDDIYEITERQWKTPTGHQMTMRNYKRK